ncbi:LysE family translocator [candidate division KSB1 bacterium]|nr:LysE family translocator [candidate division KSB1 bacterium]
MIELTAKGIILGLSAGFSPGPLLALVISETINHNFKAGAKVAVAPLLSDTPIILLCFYVLSRFAQSHVVLAVISFIGALYIFYLGISGLKVKPFVQSTNPPKSNSLLKGILVNLLNPSPYLFWLTIGSTIMINALKSGISFLLLFLAGFYVCLVGSKLLVAALTGQSKSFIIGKAYIYINRILSVLLILLAFVVAYDGYQLLIS